MGVREGPPESPGGSPVRPWECTFQAEADLGLGQGSSRTEGWPWWRVCSEHRVCVTREEPGKVQGLAQTGILQELPAQAPLSEWVNGPYMLPGLAMTRGEESHRQGRLAQTHSEKLPCSVRWPWKGPALLSPPQPCTTPKDGFACLLCTCWNPEWVLLGLVFVGLSLQRVRWWTRGWNYLLWLTKLP